MRSYLDACGITRALDVVGERWAIPVVRELIFGPRRYSDLATALPGISTNILGARLNELVSVGVVAKRRLPPPAAVNVYELTSWGAALEPVLIDLGRWASHTTVDVSRQAFSASSLALSLKATFDDNAAAGVFLDVQLLMGEDAFDVHIDDGSLAVSRSDSATILASDVRLQADPKTIAAYIHHRLDPAEVPIGEAVRIEGTPESVKSFVQCFTLPDLR